MEVLSLAEHIRNLAHSFNSETPYVENLLVLQLVRYPCFTQIMSDHLSTPCALRSIGEMI